MKEQVVYKVQNGEVLTKEETKIYLDTLVNDLRIKFDIKKFDGKKEFDFFGIMKCNEVSNKISFDMATWGFSNYCVNINTEQIIDKDICHHSNIIALNVEGKITPYLIDPTYPQFFLEKYPLGHGKYTYTKNKFNNDDRNKLGQELNENGYIKVDDYILKLYLDIFLEAYNDRRNEKDEKISDKNIDNEIVYARMQKELDNSAIIIPINLEQQKMLLTQFRNDIIEVIKSQQGYGEKIENETDKTL